MSKHNKYHNYNNYSANKPEVKIEEPVVETPEVTLVTEEVEQVEVAEIAEVSPAAGLRTNISPVDEVALVEEPAVETTEAKIGVVNCKLLRVRSEADATADNVIWELPEGTEVYIDETKSTVDFYKIVTAAGAEGFCMKKFITIK